MCVSHFIVFIAHLSIIVIISKARLKQNRFFIVQMLSSSDLLFSLNNASFAFAFGFVGVSEKVNIVFTFIGGSFHVLSLQIIILLNIDRYMAVKFSVMNCWLIKPD